VRGAHGLRGRLAAGLRAGARLSRAQPLRTRALALALVVAAIAGAVTAFAEGGGDGRAKSASAAAAQGPGAHAAKGGTLPAHKGPLFRIVGCASHGTSAYRNGPRVREVAIAFDDGPARLTPAFVALLEREHVPATFFMIGREITAGERGLLLRELADGDALGDHTYNHANLTISHHAHGELAATIARIQQLSEIGRAHV